MISEINDWPEHFSPAGFYAVGNHVYFSADHPYYGRELWKSDGTQAGTLLVKDIYPGVGSSEGRPLAEVNGTLYFTALDHYGAGLELWKSDGSAAGTVRVKDIFPGSGHSYPRNGYNLNGTLYFSADDGTNGRELWKSDGTEAGTVLVKNINPGGYSDPFSFVDVGSNLFFIADDGSGREVWKSDGTEEGTFPVTNSSGGVGRIINVGGVAYFVSYDGSSGSELWRSNGTADGTVMVKDIFPGVGSSRPDYLTNVGGVLFFRADDGKDGVNTELWKSDGTTEGTVMVKDIQSGYRQSGFPRFLTNVNGELYFYADEGVHGGELWKSDGTDQGTILVQDIHPSGSSDIAYMRDVNGTLFFRADNGVTGGEIWKSDGTPSGTIQIKDIFDGFNSSTPKNFTNLNGSLVFSAVANPIVGAQVWITDGLENGTTQVSNFIGSRSSNIHILGNQNGNVYFSAMDGTNNYALWKSDGTASGTQRVRDIQSGHVSEGFGWFTDVGDKVLFVSNDGTHGHELWKSDGTESGTALVKDIQPPSAPVTPGLFCNVNGTLFFMANDGSHGRELWKSNGTETGTEMVLDIYPPGGDGPKSLFNYNGLLLFGASDTDKNSPDLWSSDGTAVGTKLVKRFEMGGLGFGTNYTISNGIVFFTAGVNGTGNELWKSDGTQDGTQLVRDIRPGGAGSHPGSMIDFSGVLYFFADDGIHGVELWKSDGTEAGTQLVKNIRPDGGNFSPYLTNVNGTLYFSANDGTHGAELWKSDGTEAGTVQVQDIFPGDQSSGPKYLREVNGTLYFVANDGTRGRELWTSDGTEAGTVIIADIAEGITSSYPSNLINANGQLFFGATNEFGRELWTIDGPSDVTLSSNNLPENSAGNTIVGQLNSVSSSQSDTFVYALINGIGDRDNGLFTIEGNNLRANQGFDFESQSNYTVRIRSTDQDGFYLDETFVIHVTDINEAPTDIALSSTSIAENMGGNVMVGALSTTDTDAGDRFTYTLVSGAGDADNAAFDLSDNTLKATNNFDFETKSSYMVRVRSTDQGGLFTEKAFTITITNVNEAPVDIALSSTSIPENAGMNAVVGALSTVDPDAGNSFTYTLVAGTGDSDNGAFNVDGSNLRANASLDFETKSSYTVRVRSTDQGGLFTEKVFTLIVTDDSESPVDIALSSTSIAENAGLNAVVGALSTVDPDAGNSFTYTLVAGTGDSDNGAFNIDGSNLRANASFDFEMKSSYTVRVRSTDQGGLFTEKVFTLIVTDESESPVDIALSSTSIAENAGMNAVVGALSTVDPDAGNTFTYTLVAGTGDSDNGAFNVDGSNLRANASFDFEMKSSYTVRVRSTDQGGLFTEKVFTINVTDIPEGVLVNGTGGNDTILVTYLGDGTTHSWSVKINATAAFNASGNLMVDGLAGTDTLQVIGRATNDVYVQEANRLLLNGAIVLFPRIENLRSVAGLGDDTLQVLEPVVAGVSAAYDGSGGSDILEAASGANSWNVTGAGIGNLNGIFSFLGVESLRGGTGVDQFILSNAGRITGQIQGGAGNDTLNLSAKTTIHSVNLQTNTATSTGGISSIENFISGNLSTIADVLIGANSATTWTVNGANSGNLSSSPTGDVFFSGFESLTGGTALDNFVVTNNGSLSKILTGGTATGVIDTLDLSAKSTALDFRLDATTSSIPGSLGAYTGFERITGNGLADTKVTRVNNTTTAWAITSTGQISVNSVNYVNVANIVGGPGVDTLTGPALAVEDTATWTLSSAGGGTLAIPGASVAFSGMNNLTGGTGADAFEILPGGSLPGAINGGTGTGLNSLSYAQWTSSVSVNLAVTTAANATAIAGVTSNIQLVIGGSGNDTLQGQASKSTILVGLGGNDTLTGGSQRDLLFGGTGADILVGSAGDDLLISGSTSHDTNRQALFAIYSEWISTRTFAVRTANIWGNGSGTNANGQYRLNSDASDSITDTVFADSDIDSLTGGLNQDWFFASVNDTADFNGAGAAPDRLNR